MLTQRETHRRIVLPTAILLTSALSGVVHAGATAAPPAAADVIAEKVARFQREFQLGKLPESAHKKLAESLAAAAPHPFQVWRDVPALNPDGTVNVYVEIERGDLTKWEFDLAKNRRAVDRVLPESLGGYPVNYGFVPQTIFDDGDPFDHLLLGPKATGGAMLTAAIVGLMHFVDEKGIDSKVIVSPIDPDGKPVHALDPETRRALESFFDAYKIHEAKKGKFSRVAGFGDAAEGLRYVQAATGYFASAAAPRPAAAR